MSTIVIKDHYVKTDIQGQQHLYELYQEGDQWGVQAWTWNADAAAGDGEYTHMWSVNYKVIGYVNGNPNRQITDPLTEAEARAEFERWRT